MTTSKKTDGTADAPLATPEEVKSFRDQQRDEWGQYVALVPITYNGALAYNAGDPVPASNVERHGYLRDGLVAKVESKEVQAVVKAISESATDQGSVDIGEPVSLGVPVK